MGAQANRTEYETTPLDIVTNTTPFYGREKEPAVRKHAALVSAWRPLTDENPGSASVMSRDVAPGGGGAVLVPTTYEVRGNVPTRFESEVAQIRCLFRFLGYFVE